METIAESGWHGLDAISGLIAHELGHLVHCAWRERLGRETGSGPWWQLYEEGFAQYCESLLLEMDGRRKTDDGLSVSGPRSSVPNRQIA